MATAKSKQKAFIAWATLRLDIGIPVYGETMEEALKLAKEWSVSNLIDFDKNKWEHNDSELNITGIHENTL